MKEERYFYVPNAVNTNELPTNEATHATRVLRLKEGDNIFLMDGIGTFHQAEVTMTTGKRCAYRITESIPQPHPWQHHIHIAMAPTKMMDRVEWMAEKATEIGIDEISFLECQFSERRQLRSDRIEKIVVAATKQSRKAWKPIVNDLQLFKSFITQKRPGRKFICHCYNEIERHDLYQLLLSSQEITSTTSPTSDANPDSDNPITILIGPEGDFSIDEVRMAISHGYTSVSLGNQRLRTETAALYAVMIAQLAQR